MVPRVHVALQWVFQGIQEYFRSVGGELGCGREAPEKALGDPKGSQGIPGNLGVVQALSMPF